MRISKPDLESLLKLVRSEIWEKDFEDRNRFVRFVFYTARIVYALIDNLLAGEFTLWARSLAFTTILSLVPLLAVSFSVLKAFGAHQQLEPLLLEVMAPLGEKGTEVAENILRFVSNIKVGVLSSLGIALLFYTVVSLLQTVEQAFNAIWRVPNTRQLTRRFSDYLSVILVGPVLILAALGLTASAMRSEAVQSLAAIKPFGSLIVAVNQAAPYLLVCIAFAFLYAFITNTRVRATAALAGGIFAGIFWYATGMIFATFVASSSSYSGVYSGFAGAVLFIVWLQMGWLIILLGAQVAFYWQYPKLLNPSYKRGGLSNRQREHLALEIIALIAEAHYNNRPLWTMEALQARLGGIASGELANIVHGLLVRKLIVASHDQPARYLPAHSIATIELKTVVAVVRGENVIRSPLVTVDRVLDEVDAAIAQSLGDRTVKDLVVASSDRGKPAPVPSRPESY
jgi:membrane protein